MKDKYENIKITLEETEKSKMEKELEKYRR
jgi:hypothetical protein